MKYRYKNFCGTYSMRQRTHLPLARSMGKFESYSVKSTIAFKNSIKLFIVKLRLPLLNKR